VYERIPYLILPVRQLLREPFGKHRMRPTICRTRPMRASRQARRRAHLESNRVPKRCERAVGQDAGPVSNHPRKRYTSEPSGKPPGPSRSMHRRLSRRAHRAVH